jgi:hypothetical protein
MPSKKAKPRKKVARKATSKVYKTARIGRLIGGELKTIGFKAGETVQQLAQKAGLEIHSGEEINDEKGNTIAPTALAKEQDYWLTGNFSNGNSCL